MGLRCVWGWNPARVLWDGGGFGDGTLPAPCGFGDGTLPASCRIGDGFGDEMLPAPAGWGWVWGWDPARCLRDGGGFGVWGWDPARGLREAGSPPWHGMVVGSHLPSAWRCRRWPRPASPIMPREAAGRAGPGPLGWGRGSLGSLLTVRLHRRPLGKQTHSVPFFFFYHKGWSLLSTNLDAQRAEVPAPAGW